MSDLTMVAFIILTLLIIFAIYFGLRSKKEEVEIDKGADDFLKLNEYEIALRSIAYDTKSISTARKIAEQVLTDD